MSSDAKSNEANNWSPQQVMKEAIRAAEKTESRKKPELRAISKRQPLGWRLHL